MAGGSSYYAVLGVARHASAAEIRSAWRRLSLQWHPDKLKWAPESPLKERARARYQAIQDAYRVLSDPAKKTLYDAGLLLQTQVDAARAAAKDRMDELAARMGKMTTKDKESDGQPRAPAGRGRPRKNGGASSAAAPVVQISLLFHFPTAAAPGAGSSGGAAGPPNAGGKPPAGSSAAGRRGRPRKRVCPILEATTLRFRKD